MKQSMIQKYSDPLIIAGNLPYNMILYKLGFNLPWKEPRVNEYTIVCQHLEKGRIENALMITQFIEDPELFMQSFAHVANYLMRRPSILSHKSVINLLIKIHYYAVARPEVEYLKNFLNQY